MIKMLLPATCIMDITKCFYNPNVRVLSVYIANRTCMFLQTFDETLATMYLAILYTKSIIAIIDLLYMYTCMCTLYFYGP